MTGWMVTVVVGVGWWWGVSVSVSVCLCLFGGGGVCLGGWGGGWWWWFWWLIKGYGLLVCCGKTSHKCRANSNVLRPEESTTTSPLYTILHYTRGERLSQTYSLIGQEIQFSSYCPIRARELYLLSNQNVSL